MTFESLEQRMVQAYIDLFPRFVPDEVSGIDIAEQERFYIIMKGLYQFISDDPTLIVPALHEDDAFPNRYSKSSYGKPELQANIRKVIKAMETLLHELFISGQGANVMLNKKQMTALSELGVDDMTRLPKAWSWMASRPGANLISFSYCLFKEDHSYTPDIYARLLGETAFRKLENWMIDKGYKHYDIHHTTASDCKLSLTYANPAWSTERPNGGFEYKVKNTGIAAQYDPCFKQPVALGLCIPKGLMKTLIESFDSMSKSMKAFIVDRTTKCWGCRFCVQTDKTGKRPLANIPIEYDSTEYTLCTYFPGYSYCWSHIDDELADRLIEMLSFMDKSAPSE